MAANDATDDHGCQRELQISGRKLAQTPAVVAKLSGVRGPRNFIERNEDPPLDLDERDLVGLVSSQCAAVNARSAIANQGVIPLRLVFHVLLA